MIVYRYMEFEYGKQALNDLQLRTSIPDSLNDPFELSPNIDPSQFTQKRCETFLKQDYNIEERYQIEGRKNGFTNKKQFKRWYMKDLPRRAAALLPKVPTNIEAVRLNFAQTLGKQFHIISASLLPDSVLMWSHYAKNHSGMVIGLKLSEEPFKQLGADYIIPVKYSATKADYVHHVRASKFEKRILSVAATKGDQWEYEKEVRILVPSSVRVLHAGRFLPISPLSVASVCFGCRTDNKTKTSVMQILKKPHFRHVELYHARLHPSEYSLIIERST